ncbi:MAG: hypothetical protein COZ37_02620, partial [bacterium (Candidatus Ratteibacteria) CG_4_10_14_3_um_filter_41_18]
MVSSGGSYKWPYGGSINVTRDNQADTLIYTTEKSLKDYGDKISDTDKKNIEDKISQLKKDLETKDKEKIKKSMDELSTASHKLAEVLYQEAQK